MERIWIKKILFIRNVNKAKYKHINDSDILLDGFKPEKKSLFVNIKVIINEYVLNMAFVLMKNNENIIIDRTIPIFYNNY